jgi:ankyrin repeat protein
MTENEKEFFQLIKDDDIFGLTAMINEDRGLVNAVNENGISAVMFAMYYGRKEVTALLVHSGAKLDPVSAAAAGDKKRVVECLAEDKAFLEEHSKDGWTALHLASYFGHKEIVQLLLEAGAPVLARSKNGMNNHPLHAAAAGKSRDIVAMLLSAGAEVNATQSGGWTALHAAAQDGDAEMVKLLLMNGADPDLRADNGQSALDLAMGKGAQEVVDMLEARPGIQ